MRNRGPLVSGRLGSCLVGLVGLLVVLLPVSASAAGTALPDLPGLRPQVEFWKKIFTRYSSHEVVIHDVWELDRIYSVLDFREVAAEMSPEGLKVYRESRTKDEIERIRALLVRLHQRGGSEVGLSGEERRILALFRGDRNPQRFLVAAEPDRLRSQRGIRERFGEGLRISRRYLPSMESVFRRHGLPIELTRLPLIESSFQVRAYSKVGAAGVWQFMPDTARSFLRLDDQVDERLDPLLATEAAAQFLQGNYRALGNWPLAVTAYNHGRAGMARAAEAVGSTDLVRIVRTYRGPRFGFASRNFYAELLAAIEVERDPQPYFGRLQPEVARPTRSVPVAASASFGILARAARVSPAELSDLNPALTPDVVRGRLPVPRGFALKIPAESAATFPSQVAALAPRPAAKPAPAPRAATSKPAAPKLVRHRVEKGQTLSSIARRYGTTVAAIQRKNGMRAGTPIRVGESLLIPRG